MNLGLQFAGGWGQEERGGGGGGEVIQHTRTAGGAGGLELDDMHGDTVPCDQQSANLCPFPSTRSVSNLKAI